ncbi:MAG: type II secretion system F family protein [Candidatus Saccharibacteria bacterium]
MSEIPYAIGFFAAAAVLLLALGIDIRRGRRIPVLTETPASGRRTLDDFLIAVFTPLVPLAFPENVRDNTLTKLRHAGIAEEMSSTKFLAIKLAGACFIALAALILVLVANMDPVWPIILAAVGYMVPNFWLKRKITIRQRQLRKDIPDFGLFFATALSAGGGDVYGALNISGSKFGGELGKEIAITTHDINSGKRRTDALYDMAERCGIEELSELMDAVIQADQLGHSIAKAVKEHSAQVRIIRRFEAEKAASEAVVKLVFPMLVFIVMPLLVLLAYPALQQLKRAIMS